VSAVWRTNLPDWTDREDWTVSSNVNDSFAVGIAGAAPELFAGGFAALRGAQHRWFSAFRAGWDFIR